MRAAGVVASLVLALAGCTITREFDGEEPTVDQLHALVEARTKAEVLDEVGPPEAIGLRMDGSVFVYRFRFEEQDSLNASFFNASFDYDTTDRRVQRLAVFFDKRGRKTGFGLDRARTPDEEADED